MIIKEGSRIALKISVKYKKQSWAHTTGEKKEPEKGMKLNPGKGKVVGMSPCWNMKEGDEH